MARRKGQLSVLLLVLLTNPYVIGALAIIVMVTIGLTFFFNKLFLILIFGGVVYLMVTGAFGSMNVKQIYPIIAIAVAAPVLFQFAGMQIGTGDTLSMQALAAAGSSPTVDSEYGEVQIPRSGVELGEPQGSVLASTTIAPRTFRNATVKLRNPDSLPLVIDSAKVVAWVGSCSAVKKEGVELPKECTVNEGETYQINEGWLDGFADFVNKVFNHANAGITGKRPDKQGFFSQQTRDWQDKAVVRNIQFNNGEGVALWSKEKCRNTDTIGVDCSNVRETVTVPAGWIWADKSVDTPATKKLNVMVLMPQEKSLSNRIITTLSAGAVDKQPYTVIAKKTRSVNIATPNIQIIVLIGALGLIASVAALRGWIPAIG